MYSVLIIWAACHRNPELQLPMEEHPINKVHQLLEPGPVILITTRDKDGNANVMTCGFHMVVQHEPPLFAVIVGPWDHSFNVLRTTKECVIAVPTVEQASTVVDIGNCSGADIDKFEQFDLTITPGNEVKAPLISECSANIECRVSDTRMISRYNMFVLEAVQAWHNPKLKDHKTIHHRGDGTFMVDGEIINLQDRMVKWQEYAE
jgi:flavin reductase (DIM6/NTAB) family NADH-FMN oxidoreductase RutF